MKSSKAGASKQHQKSQTKQHKRKRIQPTSDAPRSLAFFFFRRCFCSSSSFIRLPSFSPSIYRQGYSFSLLSHSLSLSCTLCIKLFFDFASITHKRPPCLSSFPVHPTPPKHSNKNKNNDHHIEKKKRNEEKASFAPLLYTETITADKIGGGSIHHHARTKPKHKSPSSKNGPRRPTTESRET